MDTRVTAEEVLRGDALSWRNQTLIVEDVITDDDKGETTIVCQGGKNITISPQAVVTILTEEDPYDEY